MGIEDHYRRSERLTVKIITVDPPTGRLEGIGKDAAVIQISAQSYSNTFRWPKVDEIWTIVRNNIVWELEGRLPNANDPVQPSDGLPGDFMGPDGFIPQHKTKATSGQGLVWTGGEWIPQSLATQAAFTNQDNIPKYGANQLPITGLYTGQLILFQWENVNSLWALGRWNPIIGGIGAWETIGHSIPLFDSSAPTALAAGTGWRKPTGTPSIAVTYHGSYIWNGGADLVYNAAESVGGVAIGSLATAEGATSQGVSTFGQADPNYRTSPRLQPDIRLNTTLGNSSTLTWDLRFFSTSSVTITFARAMLSCRPAYCYGVA